MVNPYELADELDKMLKSIGLEDNRVPTVLRKQADRIAELEDRLSMYEIKDLDRGIIGRTKDYVIHDLVHRTTPQVKELSDEEIYELWCESDNTELLPEMRNKDGSINYIILTFAELLLKKASEK